MIGSSNNDSSYITQMDIQESSVEESSTSSEEKGITYYHYVFTKREQFTLKLQEDKNIVNIMCCFVGVFHWPHEAILLLLTLYAEHEHQIKSGKISMKKFWNIIASELNKKGYDVTDLQCKSKMAGMKNTYKSIKDHNAKSGNNNRKWQYCSVSI